MPQLAFCNEKSFVFKFEMKTKEEENRSKFLKKGFFASKSPTLSTKANGIVKNSVNIIGTYCQYILKSLHNFQSKFIHII